MVESSRSSTTLIQPSDIKTARRYRSPFVRAIRTCLIALMIAWLIVFLLVWSQRRIVWTLLWHGNRPHAVFFQDPSDQIRSFLPRSLHRWWLNYGQKEYKEYIVWLMQDVNVAHVSINGTTLDHTFLPSLNRCPKMMGLTLEGRQLGEGLQELNSHSHLGYLSVSHAGPESQFSHAAKLRELNHLSLHQSRFPVGGLESLRNVPELHMLNLTDSDAAILSQVVNFPQLKEVNYRTTKSIVTEIPHLQKIPQLNDLRMDAVSLEDWKAVMNLKQIHVFGGNPIDPEVYNTGAWKELKNLSNLGEVFLIYPHFGPEGLEKQHLKEAEELRPDIIWHIIID